MIGQLIKLDLNKANKFGEKRYMNFVQKNKIKDSYKW